MQESQRKTIDKKINKKSYRRASIIAIIIIAIILYIIGSIYILVNYPPRDYKTLITISKEETQTNWTLGITLHPDWHCYGLDQVKITVTRADSSVSLNLTPLVELASGNYLFGVSFIDTGRKGGLQSGDYLILDKKIYETGTRLILSISEDYILCDYIL
ncbi:MAG: hypothetical protein ACPL1K_01520 [Candidatus Kryptoniota bacterium]